jgi:hypothetical protein
MHQVSCVYDRHNPKARVNTRLSHNHWGAAVIESLGNAKLLSRTLSAQPRQDKA